MGGRCEGKYFQAIPTTDAVMIATHTGTISHKKERPLPEGGCRADFSEFFWAVSPRYTGDHFQRGLWKERGIRATFLRLFIWVTGDHFQRGLWGWGTRAQFLWALSLDYRGPFPKEGCGEGGGPGLSFFGLCLWTIGDPFQKGVVGRVGDQC